MKSKNILTENQAYILIDIWFGHDEIFTHIARGRIQSYITNGLDISFDVLWDLVGLADRGWCRMNEEA